MEFIKIRLKKTLLNELNLPDIDYLILSEFFSEGLGEDNLPYAYILFGLQNVENVTPEVIRAKTELAQLLSPNDHREVITACGDD